MKNVILYHLQNGQAKEEVPLEGQLKFISDIARFQPLGEPFFILKESTYQN